MKSVTVSPSSTSGGNKVAKTSREINYLFKHVSFKGKKIIHSVLIWLLSILLTSQCSRIARVIKHPFCGCCLSCIDMGHDADVSDSAETVRVNTEEPRAQSPEPRAQSSEPRAQSPEPRAQSPEPRAQNPELRAQNSEPRAQNSEPRAQNPEPRAQSPEPRTQSSEPRTQSSEPRAQSPEHFKELTVYISYLLGYIRIDHSLQRFDIICDSKQENNGDLTLCIH